MDSCSTSLWKNSHRLQMSVQEQERRAWHNHQKQSDDVPSSLAWRPPLRARMGSSPNCTLKPSNNFEWRKTVFEIVTTMGIRQTLRGKAFDETRAEVIQDLAFPQASQELFDPIEALIVGLKFAPISAHLPKRMKPPTECILTPPPIPNINTNERPPVTTTVFTATTPGNTVFAYRVSTSTDPTPVLKLEYFIKDYDKKRKMNQDLSATRNVTSRLFARYPPMVRRQRERVLGTKKLRTREKRTGRNDRGQSSDHTLASKRGSHRRIWQFIASKKEKERVSELSPLEQGTLDKHLSTTVPSTYKGKKSSEDNGRGQKSRDRSQIKEAVKSGQLFDFVKGINKERAKAFDSQRGEKKEKRTTPAEAPILTINQEEARIRNSISKNLNFEGREIAFPSPPTNYSSQLLITVIIEAKPLYNGGEKESWAIGEVYYGDHDSEAPLSSMRLQLLSDIVRSNSPYNMLLRRTTMQKMGMVVFTIHGAVKFHTTQGIRTMFSTHESDKINGVKKIKETSLTNTEGVLSCTDAEEKIIVNSKYPEQTITIKKQLPEHFKERETKPIVEWKFYTDGASSSDGSGAGLMLIEPEGKEYTYALRLEFETMNNESEYEALLAGLRIAQEMEIVNMAIFVDSQLLVNQIKGIYATKKPPS
ncbi:reverse transcriptase domain-containing protein [Tanacetum coccineum]